MLLKGANITIVNCIQEWSDWPFICANSNVNKCIQIDSGDWGGPLKCKLENHSKPVLLGVASRNAQEMGGYTSTAYHRNWIRYVSGV